MYITNLSFVPVHMSVFVSVSIFVFIPEVNSDSKLKVEQQEANTKLAKLTSLAKLYSADRRFKEAP